MFVNVNVLWYMYLVTLVALPSVVSGWNMVVDLCIVVPALTAKLQKVVMRKCAEAIVCRVLVWRPFVPPFNYDRWTPKTRRILLSLFRYKRRIFAPKAVERTTWRQSSTIGDTLLFVMCVRFFLFLSKNNYSFCCCCCCFTQSRPSIKKLRQKSSTCIRNYMYSLFFKKYVYTKK